MLINYFYINKIITLIVVRIEKDHSLNLKISFQKIHLLFFFIFSIFIFE